MKTLRAHGFNQRPRFEQVVGYLERNEPLPLDQPDRKATLFVTSHFYLDDFVQSTRTPTPGLCSTPLAIPEDGFRTPAKATDEDVRLVRRYIKATVEPVSLRMTWQETLRPAPWQATVRARHLLRNVCAERSTALRRQRTS